MNEVYINDVSAYLPGMPIDNDSVETVLGKINNTPSTVKAKILENNGIKTRYYALNPQTGDITHTNAQLTAEAIKKLKPYSDFSISDIELLCCGSSTPDVLLPGHGLMVHGELKSGPCEVVSTAGICLSGITAFKYGWMSVATGNTNNSVTTGSEVASSALRAQFFAYKEKKDVDSEIIKNRFLLFDSEFLRWMLSDAAGSVYMSNKRNDEGLSLKIEWIDHVSYAHEYDTCMYAGGKKNAEGKMVGYRSAGSLKDAVYNDFIPLKQDIRLLGDNIIYMCVNQHFARVMKEKGLKAEDIDWFLPHYSSHFFRDPFNEALKKIDFEIPLEKWFTNLTTKGNTGSASIYVILEELFHSGNLKKGDKLLCFIPESGRFSSAYMLLTAV